MRTATIGALDNLCNLPRGSDERRAPGRKSRSIDGKDDVWFINFYGRGVILMAGDDTKGILMAGDDTKGHPAGTKAGDVIHQFQSGSIQMITEVAVEPLGQAGGRLKARNRCHQCPYALIAVLQ
jgi:hypothetical protein